MVQLFDGTDSLADAVSEFLREGFLAGDTLLVVSTTPHWDAIAEKLSKGGVRIKQATQSGQLTRRDARDTLNLFMQHGRPDRELFEASVGSLVRQLATRDARLRIYGEMVDVLASEGDYRSAELLEEFWNALGERESFKLFCGYSAVNFGDPRTAEALRAICRSHTHVRSNPRDALGSFLLGSHSSPASGAAAL